MTLSSEWTTIRNSAVTLLQGITGIGNVYGYLRYKPGSADFLNLFKATVGSTNYIRGWVVTLEDLDVEAAATDSWNVPTTLRIDGWLSLVDADATEQIFVDLCQQVIMAIANEQQFGSSAVIDFGRTRLKGPDLVLFPPGEDGKLCHHAQITKMLTLDQSMVLV